MFLDRFKVNARLLFGFGILLLLIVGVGIFGSYEMNRIGDNTTQLYRHPYAVSTATLRIETEILRIHRAMKDVALSSDTNGIRTASAKIDDAEIQIANEFKIITERFLGNQSQVDAAKKLIADWKPIRDEVIQLMRSGNRAQAAAITKGKGATHVSKINIALSDFEEFASGKADGFVANAQAEQSLATLVSFILVGIALFLGILLALLVSRSITNPLQKIIAFSKEVATGNLDAKIDGSFYAEFGEAKNSIEAMVDGLKTNQQKITENMNRIASVMQRVAQTSSEVTASSAQVSDSSNSLSDSSSQQASSLEEISSSMAEIGAQTRTNAENAAQANNLASSAREEADQGSRDMHAMVEAMGEINESSQSINKIIKVIDEIAFQTNLLALNAAVEAARAGKHGKGFAVVAEEVRNLAGRSAKAAQETAQLIEGSMSKVQNGNAIAEKTSHALSGIQENIAKASDLVAEIAAASDEQAKGVSQINQGLSQLDSITQQNTANAEETASAAQVLATQAKELDTIVAESSSKDTTQSTQVTVARRQPQPLPQATKPAQPSPGQTPTHTQPTQSAQDGAWGDVPTQDQRPQTVKPEDIISLDDDEFGKY